MDRSFIIKTPSHSKRGSFVSKDSRLAPLPDSGAPSPMHYMVTTYDMSNARNATPFSVAGLYRGKVPWPEPKPIPGPCAYKTIRTTDLQSPFIRAKKSATFASTTGRDSFFDIQSPAPGPAKYNTIGNTFKGQHDLEWSRSTFTRFQDIDRDNGVPPPTQYFDENRDTTTKKARDSMRTSGAFRGKLLGKQNEKPQGARHTFGADKDRFKHSTYGRLDLAALIPAPGHYDNIFRYSINGGKGRVDNSEKPSSPLKQHRMEPASRLANLAKGAPSVPAPPYLDFDSDYN